MATQGMMMSERPSAISTGMVDSSISIGNYKGVMLCNRPFAGASSGVAQANAGCVAQANAENIFSFFRVKLTPKMYVYVAPFFSTSTVDHRLQTRSPVALYLQKSVFVDTARIQWFCFTMA